MFIFQTNKKLVFGQDSFKKLPELAASYGRKSVLILSSALAHTPALEFLRKGMQLLGITCREYAVATEPECDFVNDIVAKIKQEGLPDVVLAVGGGSSIDTGKAVSAMLKKSEPVDDYLEGIGIRSHDGAKIPFIASPTTAGTGSEATKNAVIRKSGMGGPKKSLRHDNFIPDVAVVDPLLTSSCPRDVTAYSGMDALAQLIESYLSVKSSLFTEMLCIEGIRSFTRSFSAALDNGTTDLGAREDMSFAAYLSGVTLANAGLASVHGIAGILGGRLAIPHGIICGRLLPDTISTMIDRMKGGDGYRVPLFKCAIIGRILAGSDLLDDYEAIEAFLVSLRSIADKADLPALGKFGVTEKEADIVASISDNKESPVKLTKEDFAAIIRKNI